MSTADESEGPAPEPAVRPLDAGTTGRPDRPEVPAGAGRRWVRPAQAAAVLGVGLAFGYLLGSSTSAPDPASGTEALPRPPTTTSGATTTVATSPYAVSTAPPPQLRWSRAEAVPALPTGAGFLGVTDPVEHTGSLVMVVGAGSTSQLWTSPDGHAWTASPLPADVFDAGSRVLTLASAPAGLLAAGSAGDLPAAWLRESDAWRRLDLGFDRDGLDAVRLLGGALDVVVGANGVAMRTWLVAHPRWERFVDVPDGLSADDPRYTWDSFLPRLVDVESGREVFRAETPAIDLHHANGEFWLRHHGQNGTAEVIVDAVPFPAFFDPAIDPGGVVAFGEAAWTSPDGASWQPVVPAYASRRFSAVGMLTTVDGSLAIIVEDENRAARLYRSRSGSNWSRASEVLEPAGCFRSARDVARRAERHVTMAGSGDGIGLCVSDDDMATWQPVLAEDLIALRRREPIDLAAGDPGWVMVTAGGNFEAMQVLVSTDGVAWLPAPLESDLQQWFPAVGMLPDRFVVVAAPVDPAGADQLEIWVGEVVG